VEILAHSYAIQRDIDLNESKTAQLGRLIFHFAKWSLPDLASSDLRIDKAVLLQHASGSPEILEASGESIGTRTACVPQQLARRVGNCSLTH
jgi:hypothetical protein